MYNHYKACILSDPKFLSYFIPQKVLQNKVFPVNSFSFDRNEIKLESFQYTINDFRHSLFLCLENRFWIYDRAAKEGFENQEFSLSYQALDKPNKTLLFSKRKKRVLGYSSIWSLIKENHLLSEGRKESYMVKSRLLRLTRGGFVSSLFDNPALVLRSSSFYKFRKHASYKGWFSLNLQYYGLLCCFYLINIERKMVAYSKKSQQKSFTQKALYYLLKNKRLKHLFLLGKPKNLNISNKET